VKHFTINFSAICAFQVYAKTNAVVIMKEVLALIEKRKQEFAQLEFFYFLRDKRIDPRQRLVWAPCVAFFTHSLGSLNKYILRQEPADSKLQEIINQHSYEDDHHWMWFLEDIEKLGFDKTMKFSDSLKFIWSEDTNKIRHVCNQFFAYTFESDPIMKLVVIEVIEATGNVFLSATSRVIQEIQQITRQDYRYFGKFHLDVETGHTMGEPGGEEFIRNIQLTEEEFKRACIIVDKLFITCSELMGEMLAYADTHSYEQPFTKHLNISQSIKAA
jgi:hypothetical protein